MLVNYTSCGIYIVLKRQDKEVIESCGVLEAKNQDGIDLSFFDDEDGMNDINSCMGRVMMNREAYENLLRLGQAVSTYGGTENKVRVVRRLN